MFGVSFSEIVLIATVALVVVGPRRLPEILGTLGQWIARLRRMTTEMRRQTGIDEILREEGVAGGIAELRAMMRGDFAGAHHLGPATPPAAGTSGPGAVVDAYGEAVEFDRLREYPPEGPDSYGAIPEDLIPNEASPVAPDEPGTPAEAEGPKPTPLEMPASSKGSE